VLAAPKTNGIKCGLTGFLPDIGQVVGSDQYLTGQGRTV
tara:strand:- start:1619 stop:1735 length:117 start_codon:yes stop_codon:yes gene_type:complete